MRKSLDVYPIIPWLRNNDKYSAYLPMVIENIKSQDCPVKIREPFVTPPFSGNFTEGRMDRLNAITDRINCGIEEFLKTDATHVWIVDADVEVPPHALCSLLKMNVDLASGIYSFHNDQWMAMFGRMKDEDSFVFIPRDIKVLRNQILGEEFKVGGGNGCLLIKRRVFEQYHPDVTPLRFLCPKDYASDLYFWHRAQKAGFTARINGGVLCGHLGYWKLSDYEEKRDA